MLFISQITKKLKMVYAVMYRVELVAVTRAQKREMQVTEMKMLRWS